MNTVTTPWGTYRRADRTWTTPTGGMCNTMLEELLLTELVERDTDNIINRLTADGYTVRVRRDPTGVWTVELEDRQHGTVTATGPTLAATLKQVVR